MTRCVEELPDPGGPRAQGKVVLAMAGPYLKYGIPVVDSAVRCKCAPKGVT